MYEWELPAVGDRVQFNDPWFYPGCGFVTKIKTRPHHAVQVVIEEIWDNNNLRYIGKKVWLLAGHIEVVAT